MSQKQFSPVQVLIASTLKPVRDVRAFEKLALSLGETSKYRLNIIGFSDEKPAEEGKYRFFSSMSHFGSMVDRLLAQVRFIKRLVQLRPHLLICCTYEYLPLAALFKSVIGYKLVYDVQENYAANIALNSELTTWKKKMARRLIHLAERVNGIDLYLLAESCYQQEMPEKRPFLLLENKYQGEIRPVSKVKLDPNQALRFCITGTITPAYGTVEGLTWFQKLLSAYPNYQLVISGHCPLFKYQWEIEDLAERIPQVQLKISNHPVPYREIEKTLLQSDVAILPYHLHPAFVDKLPTKLFECAALGIPVLMTPNPKWEDYYTAYQGGFAIDFTDTAHSVSTFQQALGQTYFSTPVTEEVLWKSQKLLFQKAIQHLLS